MCEKEALRDPGLPCAHVPQGSRRRRVWELSHACHCPLIGVGLPLGVLRKLVEKVTGGRLLHDDYEIHVGAVSECLARTPVAEAVQKELERRYAVAIARFRAARTVEEVGALWDAAVAAGEVAGAFWAGLSHPRCDAALEEKMCRDIHMVQHQAGACARADIDRFKAVLAENGRLERELTRMQERCRALVQDKADQAARQERLLMQARAGAIAKDTEIQQLRLELERLAAAVPELDTRQRLANRVAQLEAREGALKAQLAELKAVRSETPAPREEPAAAPAPAPEALPVRLYNRSVLCVGGRSANVPSYRSLIERAGGQFAHHDGGLEDSSSLLDASLAAADLVICQTGCISHAAYWRVKDHCKRTGKRCVFVENPSVSSLARGLQDAGSDSPAAQRA
ncbi:hypothetical protein B0920_17865 [Massilia sp. KIM]|uniref:DUF2325 domain-containing protein n=1 Tax=Massilia sp. KIM TaxID=1955422 RepID=UPI00098FF893|nr:DUF2325 domain-containing protein [Massilia sp. KIM]OON60820.1 hypothetical protein B0920_17865 [Massilia sp. KIM]